MKSVQQLFDEVSQASYHGEDFVSFVYDLTKDLDTRGSPELRALRYTVPGPDVRQPNPDGSTEPVKWGVLRHDGYDLPEHLSRLIETCGFFAVHEPSQGLDLIPLCEETYARSVLTSCLLDFAFYQGEDSELASYMLEKIRAYVSSVDWSDADDVTRNAYWNGDVSACPVDTFAVAALQMKLEDDRHGKIPADDWEYLEIGLQEAMLRTLLAVWIDEVVAAPEKGLTLLAPMIKLSEWIGGMRSKYAKLSEGPSAVENASMAAYARHAKSNADKVKAIGLYLEGSYQSKDQAAERLSKSLGYSFSTVRKWLRGT